MPDANLIPRKLSLKLTVLGMYLYMQATDAPDCQQMQLSVEDVVLIMHQAMATDQQLGITDVQVVHADLSLAAVSLLLSGPGRSDCRLLWLHHC